MSDNFKLCTFYKQFKILFCRIIRRGSEVDLWLRCGQNLNPQLFLRPKGERHLSVKRRHNYIRKKKVRWMTDWKFVSDFYMWYIVSLWFIDTYFLNFFMSLLISRWYQFLIVMKNVRSRSTTSYYVYSLQKWKGFTTGAIDTM